MYRALLGRLERQLQAVAGNAQRALPYWDCFRDPELPLEFTLPANWNALYAPRAGDNVCAALSLAAFAPQITNMQRGLPDAFEVILESLPHNAAHNLLGHAMAGMSAPENPILWLFQANCAAIPIVIQTTYWVTSDELSVTPPSVTTVVQ